MVEAGCQDLPLICIWNCNLLPVHLHTTAPTFSARPGRPHTGTLLQATALCAIVHDPHLQFLGKLNRNRNLHLRLRLRLPSRLPTANRHCPKQPLIRGGPCPSISASSPPAPAPAPALPGTPQNSTCRIRSRPLPLSPAVLPSHGRRPCHRHRHRRPHPLPHLHRIPADPDTHTSRPEGAIQAVSAAATLFQRLHTLILETIDQLNDPP